MKAILEGTAAEFRQFFRTGTIDDFDSDQVCMFCGCTDTCPCPGGCSWVAPGVCSRCAGIVHEALKQDVSRVRKAAENVAKRSKTTFKGPEEAKIYYSIDNLLIPAFEHDRKLKSSYKTLFFTEMDDDKTVLSYCATKLYVARKKVLELPNPVPHGYFGKLKSGTPTNRAIAIRFYRAYLAEQPKSENELKSEKQPESEQKPSAVEPIEDNDVIAAEEKRLRQLEEKAQVNKRRWEDKENTEKKTMSKKTMDLRELAIKMGAGSDVK